MSAPGIAVIGCGDMGGKHAAAWAARPDARVVVVCDPQMDRAAALAARYGAAAFDDWRAAVAHPGVGVVSICVPAADHRDIAVAAAELGRHILCEKPMALTMDQADDMLAAARRAGVVLSVCHQYRALSRFRTMKRLIDAGRIGAPLFMRFAELREVRPKLAMHSRSLNGGPLHDMTGHLFDLGRYLTGAEAVSVSAVGGVFGKGKPRLREVTDFGIDTAEIQVRFAGGHCLSIGLNWGLPENTPGHCHDLIHGPLGMILTLDPARPDRFLGDPSESLRVAVKTGNGTDFVTCDRDHDGPQPCIDALVAAIATGAPSPFSGEDGRSALRLILASLRAIETGAVVDLA